jgi:hypothetical protein
MDFFPGLRGTTWSRPIYDLNPDKPGYYIKLRYERMVERMECLSRSAHSITKSKEFENDVVEFFVEAKRAFKYFEAEHSLETFSGLDALEVTAKLLGLIGLNKKVFDFNENTKKIYEDNCNRLLECYIYLVLKIDKFIEEGLPGKSHYYRDYIEPYYEI